MFKSNHPKYFYTKENIRIFFNTNFDTNLYNPNKPLLVFIYGLLCNNQHYKYQIPYFEENGFQILIHDYRFHYSSSQDGDISHCNFDNITNDLKELIDHNKFKNYILIGHSMGVNICLEFAKKFPNDISKMVLISGTVIPPQDVMFDSNIVDIASPFAEKITKKYPKLFNSFWRNSFKNPIMQFIMLDGGFNKKQVDIEFIQLYMKKISELPDQLFFHLLKIMKEHDVINYLTNIKTPALIIGGDKDKIIPNYLQGILSSSLENSTLYIVKDGSHVPQADFPNLINERIELFIS